jgi:general secretion pathway protein G
MKKTIIIVLVLATLWFLYGLMGQFLGSWTISKQDKATLKQRMNIIKSAMDEYYHNTGQYPKSLDDFMRCPAGLESTWEGPYLKLSQLNDPWGNRYVYEPNSSNPANYNIICYGADGKLGGKRENRDISILMDDAELSKIVKEEREEAKIEAKKQKELSIKTSIIVGWFLLSIAAIAIYKYKRRPKVFQNMQ